MSLPPQKILSPKSWRGSKTRKVIAWQGFELNLACVSVARNWKKCTGTFGKVGNSQEEQNRGVREDHVT